MKVGDIISEKWLINAEGEGGGQGTIYKVSEKNRVEKEYALKFLRLYLNCAHNNIPFRINIIILS